MIGRMFTPKPVRYSMSTRVEAFLRSAGTAWPLVQKLIGKSTS